MRIISIPKANLRDAKEHPVMGWGSMRLGASKIDFVVAVVPHRQAATSIHIELTVRLSSTAAGGIDDQIGQICWRTLRC